MDLHKALKSLFENRMPSDEEVKIKINSIPAKKQRHITGKKTKGHGAS